ncbi:rare lipoprotein A [Altererythrobacter atlanticus]|uniref:Rare lipoprotein A n=1 Tax=Croceibacterium atlanticum TaxID=1267766 RepID=A0A0F7KS67_9SPHN|nr:SPOR domain-containing protein [Croceibacterium atlanticum]AKH41600.1 Rare lipoprotein A precursor [Croceibacterium atlanticum]MBB5733062.1 rare lipoprotein A [Croceibacterium atlanticum]
MRLSDDRAIHACRIALALTLGLSLAACNTQGAGQAGLQSAGAMPANGPGADYPVVVGDAYQIDGKEYVPQDVLNYDEVGIATLDVDGGAGITGAHHTLPLPSYAEVTSLETGRTILIRLERRGPMDGTQLIALSSDAMAQLGAREGVPVRLRRTNPPEQERALLRAGQAPPLRMDTPMSLVEVLRQRLPSAAQSSAPEALADAKAPAPPEAPGTLIGPKPEASSFEEAFERETAAQVEAPTGETGSFMVQAATFSTAERAEKAADRLGGKAVPSGRYFLERTGPFSTREQAEASLAKVRAAGYTDARIFNKS